MFACPNCAIPSFQSLKRLLQHIRLSHHDQESFTIQCNFQGCKRTFRNLRTFENHIYSYHHNISTVNVIGREETDALDFGDVNNSTESEEGVLTPVIDTDVNEMEEESSDILQCLSSLLYYCVYSNYNMSLTQMSCIFRGQPQHGY